MDVPNNDAGNTNGSYQNSGVSYNNQSFNSAGALEIRLDTSVVGEFEKFLRGKDEQVVVNNNGEPSVISFWEGKPIVNSIGYQAIMQWMNIAINKASLQANFIQEQDYGNYLSDLHKDVLQDLMINRHRYGLHMKDFQAVLHKFMDCATIILTRPIFNEERKGMNNTTRIQETMQSHTANRGFSIPLFGGRK